MHGKNEKGSSQMCIEPVSQWNARSYAIIGFPMCVNKKLVMMINIPPVAAGPVPSKRLLKLLTKVNYDKALPATRE